MNESFCWLDNTDVYMCGSPLENFVYESIPGSLVVSSMSYSSYLDGLWCGPNLGPQKDNSEHGISFKIYWSNKI